MGRSWMKGENIEHTFAVLHRPSIGVEFRTQNALLVRIMPPINIEELPAGRGVVAFRDPTTIAKGPAGKRAGHLIDVGIDVAGGHASGRSGHRLPVVIEVVEIVLRTERMQLKQFASEVLVCGAGARGFIVEVE